MTQMPQGSPGASHLITFCILFHTFLRSRQLRTYGVALQIVSSRVSVGKRFERLLALSQERKAGRKLSKLSVKVIAISFVETAMSKCTA